MTQSIDQQAEGAGQNVYAGRDVVIHGTTPADVVAICEQVWKANFPTYVEAAAAEAERRIDVFGKKLFSAFAANGGPEPIKNFSDPGLQASLLDAMRGVARSGDENLGDILATILVERAQRTSRTILQLSLDEALLVAAKLTVEHYRALSLSFVTLRIKFHGAASPQHLYKILQTSLIPFGESLKISDSDVQYLEATGCGSISSIMSATLQASLLNTYPGVFSKGFPKQDADDYQHLIQNVPFIPAPLVQCPGNIDNLQVRAVDEQELEALVDKLGNPRDSEFIRDKFVNTPRLTIDEVVSELVTFDQRFDQVIKNWDGSLLRSFTPTVAGIAIGHANIRRVLGSEFPADLEIWIN
jgi:hypothetical protein